ncbi:MAG: DUF721 domain-containing protein [Candidatus Omnitrophica bacterium]|nr:DUF721 domain-containing protein [Candidatus Omnitrophota bacterium]
MDNIEDIIKDVIGNMASRKMEEHDKIHRLWVNVLSETELKHTKLLGVKDGRIAVVVDSPAWLYQMNTRKRKILQILKEELATVESIYFKVGKIS